ncbi:MAG: maltose alpha-D-glucosyltransferase [Candidatus Thiodiazotropha sp.]
MLSQNAETNGDPLWYKDAIIYELHVKAFKDGNDDGIGDFLGLKEKLDYIRDLGVNTLWLLPFYPSPQRDDGYDISDYRNVHPDYGTRKDFRAFMREAHRRDLRVITELVINHTSDQHPWFQAARTAPEDSRKRNFYVWSKTNRKFPETRIIFTDSETSNWTWDDAAQAYYWHRFFHHQPDLNHNNPEVVQAVIRLMRFWLDMGVDGLRLDAIPYLCVREGTNNENLPESHAVLKQMRAVVDNHYRNRVFLAEANQWPEDAQEYFGQGDECHMAYHFPLMPRMYMAVAQEDRYPIVEIMQQTPAIPETCQWAVFLRNHDELTLEMVTDRERDYMYQRYAADPRMRLNVGIRRRLAPLMDNEPAKIKLMNSLLMSMPGSPIIYYGDEIGMGDNFFLGDRNGVRTPMQWTPDRNGGFSKVDPQYLYLPPIMDPIYGYEALNVETQEREPASLLNWMKRLISVRKAHPAFGRGSLTFLSPGNRKILAYMREYDGESLLCVANLARTAQPVELDLSPYNGRVPIEMLGRTPFPPIGELPYLLTLPGHDFYWFRLATESEVPVWHSGGLPPLELPMLVLFEAWRSFFPAMVEPQRKPMAKQLLSQLEREILPRYLPSRRWYAAKAERLKSVAVLESTAWSVEQEHWLLLWIEARFDSGVRQSYTLPLAIAWGELDEDHIRPLLPVTLARVRQQARMGILYDAMSDEVFLSNLIAAMGDRLELPFAGGLLRFSATAAYPRLVGEAPLQGISRPSAEGSNSAAILGQRLFLKLYRHIRRGINPELEMTRYLTEVVPFPHIPPLAGSIEFHADDGQVSSVALLLGHVDNQGDGWGFSIDYLDRFFDDCLTKPQSIPAEPAERYADYKWMMHTLGRRTGELHQALARVSGDPAFDPEPVAAEDLRAWGDQVRMDLDETLGLLETHGEHIEERHGASVAQLQQARDALLQRIAELTPASIDAVKTRYHGDYHLGQVLLTENDFVIFDFEGEPAKPLEARRVKHSPLRDVAGMLRSFDYAAAVALGRCTEERPEYREQLMPYLNEWIRFSAESFLSGYREGIADCPSWPGDPHQARQLIGLFLMEKALYELRYELSHRPDWVGIPLAGLLQMLRSPLPGLGA